MLIEYYSVFPSLHSWAAEEDDQQDAEEVAGGDGSGDSDENLAKIAANVSGTQVNRNNNKTHFERYFDILYLF